MKKIHGFAPIDVSPHHKGGIHLLYRFPNGYGASVIPGLGQDKELALVQWTGDRLTLGIDYHFVHNNPITGDADVVIRLATQYVQETLARIAALTDADIADWRKNSR